MVKELKIPRDRIDIAKPITSYGLDSLKAVILARDAEDYFGIEWPLEMFLEETTVQNLAAPAAPTPGQRLVDDRARISAPADGEIRLTYRELAALIEDAVKAMR